MTNVQYKIYQFRKTTDYCFMSWDFAKDHGFDIRDYAEVYSGEIPQKNCLDELFYKFNVDYPADFIGRGHSLSVSDVVAIKTERNDYWYWYYCDSFGWEEITEKVNG